VVGTSYPHRVTTGGACKAFENRCARCRVRADSIRPIDENSFDGTTWELYTELETGTVTFGAGVYRQNDGYYLYDGTYTPDGASSTTPVQLKVETSDLGRMYVQIMDYGPEGDPESFIGELFSHELAFIAGHTTPVDPVHPFYMVLQ
jgi:hypothetical protein